MDYGSLGLRGPHVSRIAFGNWSSGGDWGSVDRKAALAVTREALAGGDGPLPVLLVALTVVTGLVDAFSYLVLGRVFVANMTGNIVFLGFALAGAPGFSISTSVVALLAFTIGAAAGGRLGLRLGARRGHLLAWGSAIEASLLALAAIAAGLGWPDSEPGRALLVVPLAIALGVQNATARRLAVPDLTTTVLTLTLTGIAADGRFGAGGDGRIGRRSAAVLAMLIGAAVGALLIGAHGSALVLPLAAGTAVLVGAGSYAAIAEPPAAGESATTSASDRSGSARG
jgi:uncharacterized membrane protein YoaK (UPF0700 family)